jgi:hypothetical protein
MGITAMTCVDAALSGLLSVRDVSDIGATST